MSGSERVGVAGVPRRMLGELPALAPALLLALMLACVLVPLPQFLVDLLLSGSLAFSVLLLVAALRIDVASRFTVFPGLLLLVTALRLVLNLATTRLILGEADAGRVIDAFAGFVTRGDLVVGAVMFGIVTAIQYLVIARGTERVAEVAARFALDGMPGRQAAIAADLQSRSISPAEASRRRAQLDARSDFYGAMDGAVKFVKGDAVVGLVIVAVNLIGGLAIGVGRMDYSVGQSLELYGQLTIGDGLLAQIPAVLVSLAAAVLVSRIDAAPGQGRSDWLSPTMLLVPAALLLGVAVVPGMPRVAFVFVGLVLVAGAWAAMAREPRVEAAGRGEAIVLKLGDDLRTAELASDTLASLRASAEAATGLALPPLVLDEGAAVGHVEMWRGERRLATVPAVEGAADARWLNAAYQALTRNASRLLTLDGLESELRALQSSEGFAVGVALRRVELPALLGLLRSFADDAIPVPPLASVVAAVAEEPCFTDPEQRADWPQRLREATASDWLPAVLEAYASAPRLRCTGDLLLAIEDHTRREGGRWTCSLPAARREAARRALLGRETKRALVLASARDRARLAAFFTVDHPPVVVLAQAEFEAAGLPVPPHDWIDETPFEDALVEAA